MVSTVLGRWIAAGVLSWSRSKPGIDLIQRFYIYEFLAGSEFPVPESEIDEDMQK